MVFLVVVVAFAVAPDAVVAPFAVVAPAAVVAPFAVVAPAAAVVATDPPSAVIFVSRAAISFSSVAVSASAAEIHYSDYKYFW